MVAPRAGRWEGGWPNDTSDVGVQACRTRAGDGCVRISNSLIRATTTETEARIDAVYAGWYVGALEYRRPESVLDILLLESFRDGAVSEYESKPAGPTVAAGPLLGPIAAR